MGTRPTSSGYLAHMFFFCNWYRTSRQNFQKSKNNLRKGSTWFNKVIVCAGLSSDLIIEQVLMRNKWWAHTWQGMTEQQDMLWLLSMSACAEVNQAMDNGLTGLTTNWGAEQRYNQHEASLWLEVLSSRERNPFSNDPSLQNISNGEYALSNVNVHTAQSVDNFILWMDWHLLGTPSSGRIKLSLLAWRLM